MKIHAKQKCITIANNIGKQKMLKKSIVKYPEAKQNIDNINTRNASKINVVSKISVILLD